MIYAICSKMMRIGNNNNYIDNKVWSCASLNPKHDTKLNIKHNSVYDGINIPLPIFILLHLLHFIVFVIISIDKEAYIESHYIISLFNGKTINK